MSAISQAEIDLAQKRGAEAYLLDKPMDSNPYDKAANPEAHEAWNQGWRHEKNYYEGKL